MPTSPHAALGGGHHTSGLLDPWWLERRVCGFRQNRNSAHSPPTHLYVVRLRARVSGDDAPSSGA
eukprot:11000448-Alexandrium_andersonii.AAC.1